MSDPQKYSLNMESGFLKENPPPVTILLADDHEIVRAGLRALLAHEPGLSVVGEAGDGRVAVEEAARLRPHVIVIDVSMPGLNGVDATKQIKARVPEIKVIALSMYCEKALVKRMLQAGAMAYLLKDCAAEDLVAAIRCVMTNQFHFSIAIALALREKVGGQASAGCLPETAGLDPQQRELLQLLAEGKNTKEIAERLRLSPKTVDLYRRRLMEKLQLWSIAELTKYAVRQGITPLDP
jgi:DNA-binding NarL/FixJ family response regulator